MRLTTPNLLQMYSSNTTMEDYFHNTASLFLKEIYGLMKQCYGPYGSHILIGSDIRAEATKDGKTILSKIKVTKSIPMAIHGSITSVADKQVQEVGDGSTTTILLLCKLYEAFRKLILEKKISPSEFNDKLKECIDTIIEKIKTYAIPVCVDNESGEKKIDFDFLEYAIYTSVDANRELCDKIMEMLKELNSVDPFILIETSDTDAHRYELVKGVELDGSALRPDVFFDGFSRREYNSPYIVVINGRLEINTEFFVNLADECIRNDQDIIFICTGMDDILLENIITISQTNPTQFNRLAAFQTMRTATDDRFLDICASIGATYIESDTLKRVSSLPALQNIIKKAAGTCEKAQLTEFSARFNNPKSDPEKVKQRLDIIKEKIDALEKDPSAYNDRISDLQDRKAFLSKNYAKFYVGGTSPQRKTINYELANDAVMQAVSCMKHGVVYGCNVIVPMAINDIFNSNEFNTMDYSDDEEDECRDIFLKKAIYESIRDAYVDLYAELIRNKYADMSDEDLRSWVKSDIDVVYNLVINKDTTQEPELNLRNNDSVPVMNSADTDRAILINATDMASLLATTKGFISQIPEFDILNKPYIHEDD